MQEIENLRKNNGGFIYNFFCIFCLSVTTLSYGNKGSRAFHVPEIDVFGSPIISDIQCTNIKWPKCIEYGVDYVPVSGAGKY